MKPVRVVLGAVPQMVESIMRDVLSGTPDIEIVAKGRDSAPLDYDVLVLNALEDTTEPTGYASPRPSAGIVMLGSGGRTASVFKRLSEDLSLENAVPMALERAIRLAAERS